MRRVDVKMSYITILENRKIITDPEFGTQYPDQSKSLVMIVPCRKAHPFKKFMIIHHND